MLYVVAFIVPAMLVLLSIPMVLGKVPPNRLYGFRTPKTLSSPDVWYPANKVSGVLMIIAGALSMVVNAVFLAVADWPEHMLLGWMCVSLIGPLLLGLAGSFIYLRRL